MYVTVEPCPMCIAACHYAGIREIVYAASLADFHEITGDELLAPLASGALLTGGCRREESLELLRAWAARRFFKRWSTSALRSRLEPLRKFVATARRHQAGILAFVETGVTNAVAEGINRIVKIVKNHASGFRHLQPFSDLIYLTVGDLDIPAQVPGKFRVI